MGAISIQDLEKKEEAMIPKIIHFTWFGSDPYPPLVEKCIESWRVQLPDYEIKIWDADSFDLEINNWVSQACTAKKYAFAADFARAWLLYNYGGIYLDSDILILRSSDPLLTNKAFTGFVPETLNSKWVEAEIIGSESKHPFFGELVEYYNNRNFLLENGGYDLRPITDIMAVMLSKQGLKYDNSEQDVNGVHVYPTGYFLWACHDVVKHQGSSTAYSIHYGRFSWRNKSNFMIKFMIPTLDYYREHELLIWRLINKLHLHPIIYPIYEHIRISWLKSINT